MSVVPIFNQVQVARQQSIEVGSFEKAGWALRQRLCKQMHQLCWSFFDEVDDFIFVSGQQGRLPINSDYLGAMREIRNKQILFQRTFLHSVSVFLERENKGNHSVVQQAVQRIELPAIFERMEVELAIETMNRKANKTYKPFMKQIESLTLPIVHEERKYLAGSNALVSSALIGFSEAQNIFAINLDVRLLLMKLFEQHFLLKMEKLFLDVISILNNIDNKQFVARLYSSSSSFHVPIFASTSTSTSSSCVSEEMAAYLQGVDFERAGLDAKAVESSVDEALRSIRLLEEIPAFIDEMFESHWRMLMLMIGFNKGVSGVEWQEAQHTMQMLALCCGDKLQMNSLLVDKIQQGLRLLRIDPAQQEQFIATLKQHFSVSHSSIVSSGARDNEGAEGVAEIGLEATLSPSGASILDVEDLDEIAQLVSGETTPSSSSYPNSELLADCLSAVDRIGACCSCVFLLDGKAIECIITKSSSESPFYIVSSRDSSAGDGQIVFTRSRLGLAVSMQMGELVFVESPNNNSRENATVLESND